ncbi:bacillithiol biosynthesis cysteine-adding enzyme BshC [Anseongella ginsenosidimutans]|uniref:Putative cysteine ligase BshC n=1 Tax=Anseongella ginsenosidimutans TaxID=496056 RepID=A0A4R3KPQ1_9SPHI|nr:bacillithiol biosynthesis cysteine-adding enzyme BshC [Anseongella ginsenosidimutans]QEC53976.1 bacillithiol biosynthesis cysteine-adding enzyme BshC [Anseongella ginsenosidimutans]TCS86362.1 bacillithiol biosynthesis cysteine-adding enzyme BshC [Anseongella ginsenosidimutans]
MDCKLTDPINLDFSKTGFFSKLILDYLEGAPALAPFHQYPPSVDAFSNAIKAKEKESIDRQALTEALRSQYGPSLLTPELESLIGSLNLANTYTVTTGHQLNIFGGPLYFIYKIISTINLAEAVEKANPGNRIIPVFWMATEDHDFAEINHISLFGKELKWDAKPGGATGRMDPRGMQDVLAQLKEILGSSPQAEELAALFEKAYAGHRTLADATRYFVHQLLGSYGLLIIDGDDPRLKSLFSDIIEKDILEGISSAQVIQTNRQLEETGYKTQAHPREINFFYLEENLRERIVLENGEYQVLNSDISFSPENLATEISRHPEKFSPNVIMRPVYQEKILPNLAYVGGGGELAYWMQLCSVFEAHHINFPILILRNSLLLIDENSGKKMSSLGIEPESLFQPEQQLINAFVQSHSEEELSLEEEKKAFEELFNRIGEKAFALDPTLKDSAEAEKAKFFNSLKGLENKLSKAGRRRFDTELAQLSRLRQKLFPDSGLQERHENFIPFYLKYGPSFFSELKKRLEPCLNKFQILSVR